MEIDTNGLESAALKATQGASQVANLAATCDCFDRPLPEPGDIFVPCLSRMSPEALREFVEYMEPRYGEAAAAEKLGAVGLAKWILLALFVVAAVSAFEKII